MNLVFLFPLVFSVIAAMLLTSPEYGWGLKLTVWGLVLLSLAMQFLQPLQSVFHFLVPLFLQLLVCGLWHFREHFE